jgi:uncharacterized membrane protein YphA (DoxX/SURF4 family)
MCVAFFVAHATAPFHVKELALAYLFVCLMFFFKGAGKYSLDHLIQSSSCKNDALENDTSQAKQ